MDREECPPQDPLHRTGRQTGWGMDREEHPPPLQAKLPSPVCLALPPGARLCPAGKRHTPHPWARLAVLGQGAGRGVLGARRRSAREQAGRARPPVRRPLSRPRGPWNHAQDRLNSSRWPPRGLRAGANTHLRRCRTSRKCLSENTGQERAPGARSPGGVPVTAAPVQHTPLEPEGCSPWPVRGLGSPGVLSGGTSLPRGAQCQPAPSSRPSHSVVMHTHADGHAHTDMHTHADTCTRTRMHTHADVCTRTCTHMQIHMDTHAHAHRHSHATHAHMDTHTHGHAHRHTHTHADGHTCMQMHAHGHAHGYAHTHAHGCMCPTGAVSLENLANPLYKVMTNLEGPGELQAHHPGIRWASWRRTQALVPRP